MQLRSLSAVVATTIIVVVIIVSSLAIYMFMGSFTSSSAKTVEKKARIVALKLEGVKLPKRYDLIVPAGEGQPLQLLEALHIYVRNVGEVKVKADIVYFVSRDGTLVLAKHLETPIEIPPGSVTDIAIRLTYDEYDRLVTRLRESGFLRLGYSLGGVEAECEIPSGTIRPVKPTLKNVYFNVTLVVINCTDADSWWVNVSRVITYAQKAAKRVKGLRIVIIRNSADLYTLFHDAILRGITPDNIPVEEDVHGKKLIIINAHGEPLPLPPQYIKDIDGDKKYEIAWVEYAKDIRERLLKEQWIFVTLVGAPLFYLSNNHFNYSFNTKTLSFEFPDGTIVPLDARCNPNPPPDLIAECSVETDSGEWLSFQIRVGQNYTEVIVVERRFTNYLLSGTPDNSGPDWQGRMQAGHEYRLAINGTSWHNFHPDWGGSYKLLANLEELKAIESFFQIDLPDSISAVRGVYAGDAWADDIRDYLYGGPESAKVDTIMVYDDFKADSLSSLEGGASYWVSLKGNTQIDTANNIMRVSANDVVIRHKVGWADSNWGGYDHTISFMVNERSVTSLEWSVTLRVSNEGYFWVLLGNLTSGPWIGVRFNITSGGVLEGVSVVKLDTLDPDSDQDSARCMLARGVNISLTTWTPIQIVLDYSISGLTVKVDDREWSVDLATLTNSLGVDLQYVKPSLGFKVFGDLVLDVKAPVKVVARGWEVGGGYASAVFSIGESLYIHAGYSPPYGVLKEFGKALTDISYDFLAEVGVYYPLYLMLKPYLK